MLKLKSEHNLSEKAIDDIMETTKQMIQHQSSKIKERLSTEIPEHIFETLNDDEIFGNDTFVGLETEFLREMFFEKPQAVKLGVENVLKKVGKKYRLVEKEKLGYIVQFFPQLQELLKMPEVHEELTEENHNLFDIMDVKDGTYYKKNTSKTMKMLFCFVCIMMTLKLLIPLDLIEKNINFQYFTGVSLTLDQLFALKFKQPNFLVWQTHLI